MFKETSDKVSIRFKCIIIGIIAVSFLLNSIIFCRTSIQSYRQDNAHISELTMEGIYYRIASVFAEPITISNTMAKDILLKELLKEEDTEDEEYVNKLSEYLEQYHENYDSVFLISAKTSRYYNFDGIDRILSEEEEEDIWYYGFLEEDTQYELNRDNDQAANDEITVFVNSRIMDGDHMLGVVGVGFRIDTLHQILHSYEEEFDVTALLMDKNGIIQVATDIEREMEQINPEEEGNADTSRFTRYVPELDWYLVVEKDMTPLYHKLEYDISRVIVLFFILSAIVCALINYMVKQYIRRIRSLTKQQEEQRLNLEQQLNSQIYDSVHEFNITENCPGGVAGEIYFERLGVPVGSTYDEALITVAAKQLKKEYREGYIQTFCTENINRMYESGVEEVSYECMLRTQGERYHWVRLVAHIYQRQADGSLRMYISREDIEAQKKRMLKH